MVEHLVPPFTLNEVPEHGIKVLVRFQHTNRLQFYGLNDPTHYIFGMLLLQDSCDDVINVNTIILKRDVQQLTEIDGVLNMVQDEYLFLPIMIMYIPPPQS